MAQCWTCGVQTDGRFVSAGPKDHHRTLKSDDTVAVKVFLSCADSFFSYILLSCDARGCNLFNMRFIKFTAASCDLYKSRSYAMRLLSGLWSRCVQQRTSQGLFSERPRLQWLILLILIDLEDRSKPLQKQIAFVARRICCTILFEVASELKFHSTADPCWSDGTFFWHVLNTSPRFNNPICLSA